MEKVIDLKDLLKHEITDLYSAEEQIIEALPLMIEKAGNAKLKAALEDHLKVTENQKSRLDDIKQMLTEEPSAASEGEVEKPGFFSRLFGGGGEKCKGMEGLIAEGQKVMATDMSPEASDAAIIACAQKIEHYEICGYGTARAFARELNLGEVAEKLEETLKEEYAADDLLTDLAVGKINVAAEFADGSENGTSTARRARANTFAKPAGKPVAKTRAKNAPVKKMRKGIAVKKSAIKSLPGKAAPSKSSSKQPSKSPSKQLSKSPSRKLLKTTPSQPSRKISVVKSRTSPVKSKSYKAGPSAKAPVKLKGPVKKVAVKASKAANSKSPAKKSSRRR